MDLMSHMKGIASLLKASRSRKALRLTVFLIAAMFLAFVSASCLANEITKEDANRMLDLFNGVVDLRDNIGKSMSSALSDKDKYSGKHFECLYKLDEVTNILTFNALYLSQSLAVSAEMQHPDDEAVANMAVALQIVKILKFFHQKRGIVNNASASCADDTSILGYIDGYNALEDKIRPIVEDLLERVKPREISGTGSSPHHHEDSPMGPP